MFGYVAFDRDELKIKDYHIFRAYYCGLCRQIGTHSHIARLGLSYDMTFLAILLSSLSDQPLKTKTCRCLAHPTTKRAVAVCDHAIAYSAEMSILLTYLKLRDDWTDDKRILTLPAMGAYFPAVRHIRKTYPSQYEKILSHLAALSRLERENCADIDKTADCFANILSELFTPSFIRETDTRRTLSWLGYNLGRWIYIIDAYHDMEKDQRKKTYNPFLLSHTDETIDAFKQSLKQDLEITLTYTLSNIASAYELLTVYKNDAVLRNILYLGLKKKQDNILKGSAGTSDESI